MRRVLTSSIGAAVLLGCLAVGSGSCTDAAATESAAKPVIKTKERTDDPRDQYALAYAIQEAQQSDNLDSSLARTRSEWIGHRYRWEVALVPALCTAMGPCVVMPFDHARAPAQRPIHQGWLPKLRLSPEERSALLDSCEGHRRCVIDLSGTLKQFELSTEQPTSVTLSDIQVHGTRAAAEGESWIRSGRKPKLRGARRLSP